MPIAANLVKFSFSVWMRSARTARPRFTPASTLAMAASSRLPLSAIMRAAPAVSCTGTGSMRIDDRNSSHCASACQWERARLISSRRAPGTPEQRVVHPHQGLAHDAQQAGVLEQVVGLVDRAGLRVLERDDPESGLADW